MINLSLLCCHTTQKDKRTGRPKIWIYRDKVTNEPKGDATVTYEDPHAASAAVDWFNNKDFHGSIIQVHIAESKSKDTFDDSTNMAITADLGGQDELDNDVGRGRGRGDGPGKAWQQDGDWMCPNTRSVMIGEQLLYHFSFPVDLYSLSLCIPFFLI